MQSLTQPTLLLKPFAESGDKNSIPTTNTDTSNPQRADLTNGFPAVTSLSPDSGGLPPERKDFNGLGYLTTTYDYFYQAGGTFTYNATIASAIGGYPLGARLWYTDGNGATVILRSNKANNSDNFITTPSYIGTSWVQETPALSWNNTWSGGNTFSGNITSSGTNSFSGTNTFTGNAIFKDGDLSKWGAYTLGTTPASNTLNQYHLKDTNGTVTGAFEQSYDSDGSFTTRIVCKKQDGSSYSAFGVGWDGSGNEIIYGSSGVKKVIVNWGMPNYSSATTYTKNSSASGNGYVFLCLRTTSDEDEYNITVNGKTVYTINPRHRGLIPTFVPVAKGDKVNWVNGTFTDQTTSVFVPCIGG